MKKIECDATTWYFDRRLTCQLASDEVHINQYYAQLSKPIRDMKGELLLHFWSLYRVYLKLYNR